MDSFDLMQAIRHEFDWHVRQHQGTEVYCAPSLTNPVLPMFALDRWATGPGQDTSDIYNVMRPALQLASMWLTEDLPLLWFSHLTFGHRRRNAAGQVYLERNPHYNTPAALKTVKDNLHEFGKTNFFAFAHPKSTEKFSGVTYVKKEEMSHYREFSHADFPPVLSDKGVHNPCICLAQRFSGAFRSTSASTNERYRALFIFAVVLCHEVTHGYHMFLESGDEPLWAENEQNPELGFSWELSVLGHVPVPNGKTASNDRFQEIHAIRLLEAPSNAVRGKVLRSLVGSSNAEFTTRDASGNYRNWPIVNHGKFRGATWTMSSDAQLFIASFHVVPMHWVVSWFQKDVWEALKARWVQKKLYEPPALGETFMAIYERTANGVQVYRPLYPGNRIDAMILEEHRKSVQK